MSLSERKAALLGAMHAAGGPHFGFPGQWIALSQRKPELAAALRALFRAMPTPRALGSRLHEYIGLQAGELTLYGKHSARAKAWRYAVHTPQEFEEVERKAAAAETAREERRAQLEEEWAQADVRERHRDARRAERLAAEIPNVVIRVAQPGALAELAPGPVSGPIEPTLPAGMQPSHGDEYLSTVRYDSEGLPRREYTRDRNGEPLKAHTSQPPRPQAPKPAEPPKPDPNAAPAETAGLTPPEGEWFNGCGRPRSALERWQLGRAAGQGRIEVNAGKHFQSNMPQPGPAFREDEGFADPHGVVSLNAIRGRRKWTTFGDWEP